MQPMGRKPVKFPGKVDYHPRGGRLNLNWWEVELGTSENKGGARRRAKMDAEKAAKMAG